MLNTCECKLAYFTLYYMSDRSYREYKFIKFRNPLQPPQPGLGETYPRITPNTGWGFGVGSWRGVAKGLGSCANPQPPTPPGLGLRKMFIWYSTRNIDECVEVGNFSNFKKTLEPMVCSFSIPLLHTRLGLFISVFRCY